ncbi:glyoxylase-like metal-dependent hydrolase (beta-lactamase superfamily II) [Aurantimicrobium minutum]|uniref:MBL fold metallo-hydrolase n=1 Tax=Aurantimicrobium minutum TaxID=708131 RepID=UPI002474D333|nr:MBL fold metallo-hydrolase [Aurantimicrobium minutum]MDH6277824.1 glyoxylase-like metal-dependent hydrolase (beta-lactamase superfamily II) [Aurantimicrobium minutum]
MVNSLLPPVTQVGEYVWMIPHVLPSDHPEYIATYVLLDKAGDIHLIDPGWNSESNWSELQLGLSRLGCKAKDVCSVTVTHQHKDHVGMAHHVREESGCPIALHEIEQEELLLDFLPHSVDQRNNLLEHWQVPQEHRDVLRVELETQTPNIPPRIRADILLRDGDYLLIPGRNLRIHHTPGHTPGHICIEDVDQNQVFTGDHILGEFNPGVGLGKVWKPEAMVNYLTSVATIEGLRGATGFPGHGPVIANLRSRCTEIRNHHINRVGQVTELLNSGVEPSAWSVAQSLTWTKPWDSMNPTTRRMVIAQADMYLYASRNFTGI